MTRSSRWVHDARELLISMLLVMDNVARDWGALETGERWRLEHDRDRSSASPQSRCGDGISRHNARETASMIFSMLMVKVLSEVCKMLARITKKQKKFFLSLWCG